MGTGGKIRRKHRKREREAEAGGRAWGLHPHETQCSQAMLLGSQDSVSPCIKRFNVSYKSENVFTFPLNHMKLRFDLSEAFDIGSAN